MQSQGEKGRITVKVVDTKIINEPKKQKAFVEFQLCVLEGNLQGVLWHRYQQFSDLYELLETYGAQSEGIVPHFAGNSHSLQSNSPFTISKQKKSSEMHKIISFQIKC